MVRIFLDEGMSLHPLLNAVLPMLGQLPKSARSSSPPPHGADAHRAMNDDKALTTIDSLSPREIQILQLLDTGLTNGAVTAKLFLSLLMS